jgi:hypothetical protein
MNKYDISSKYYTVAYGGIENFGAEVVYVESNI